jgi:hypothetical protein
MFRKLIIIISLFSTFLVVGCCSTVTRKDTLEWVKKRYGYQLESADSSIMYRGDGTYSEAFCIPPVECTIIFVYNCQISTNPTVKGCIGYFNNYVLPEDKEWRCNEIKRILEEGNAIPKGLEMKLNSLSPITVFDIGQVGLKR